MVMIDRGVMPPRRVMARHGMTHRVAPDRMMARRVVSDHVVAMMRLRQGRAGRHRQGQGCGEREGDELHGFTPRFFNVPRLSIRTQAFRAVQPIARPFAADSARLWRRRAGNLDLTGGGLFLEP